MQVRTEVVGGRLRLFSQYSPELIRRVRAVGGKWIVGCWEFPLESGNRVIGDLFGCSENTVRVRVKRNSDAFPLGWEEVDNCVLLGGYVLARRNSRDDAVAFVEDLMVGSVPAYGGSVKNPRVNLTEDAEFELEVRVDFAQSNGLEIISELANGLEVSAEGAAEDSHQPAVACLESFNLALEARKTPEFLALQSMYAESQKIADAAYLEICRTFQFEGIIWVAFMSGDIFPQQDE